MFHSKKRFKAFIVFLIIGVSVTLLSLPKKEEKFSFSYSETSLYVTYLNGELLELTESGAVYRYGVTRKKQELLSHSDIIFISVMLDQNEDTYVLSTHKDGTLGISKDLSFEEKTLTHMEGLKKAELCEWGLIALTEDGAVYEYEEKDFLSKVFDTNFDVQMLKKEALLKCKDIYTTQINCAVITMEGDLFVKGRVSGHEYEDFETILCSSSVRQAALSENTILALSNEGKIFEAGLEIFEPTLLYYNQFRSIPEYSSIEGIDCCGTKAVLYDMNSKILYFGEKSEGKACGESWKGEINNKKKVKQVFTRGNFIFILCKDALYIRKDNMK